VRLCLKKHNGTPHGGRSLIYEGRSRNLTTKSSEWGSTAFFKPHLRLNSGGSTTQDYPPFLQETRRSQRDFGTYFPAEAV